MKKTPSTTLADVCEIRTRYRRSVHLERDSRAPNIVDGYVLTPLALRTLTRIVDGLVGETGQRAWTLTGPYGTGKSSFEVFLFGLLAKRNEKVHHQARQLLKDAEPELAKKLGRTSKGGLLPVLLTGERTRLDDALLRALDRALTEFWSGRGARADVVSRVRAAVFDLTAGKRLRASEIVSLIEEAAAKVARSANAGEGVLIVIDELGKFLEHAALSPSEGDVYLLQLLAEAANRSGDARIVIVTTLHQAFERYAARLGTIQRSEWAKIQGRFEDVAFQESPEQLLRLVGEAIELKVHGAWFRQAHAKLADEAASLVSNAVGVRTETLVDLLGATAPLHPSTALILGPVFRSYAAQNERSLFAFLSSAEPGGFRSFLHGSSVGSGDLPSYRICDLYDYLAANMGSALEAGAQGRRWSAVEDALSRLEPANRALDASLLTTIGLLNTLGNACPVPASRDFLRFALDGHKDVSKRQIDEAIARLTKQSLIVFRRYKNSYQLWDGSDLDIEALLENARGRVDASTDLAAELERLHPARPLVAKRHLFTTGTLRYFDVRYVNAREVQAAEELLPQKAAPEADGLLVYVIPSSASEAETLRRAVAKPHFWFGAHLLQRRPLVIAIPDEAAPMRESLIELAAIEKVRQETLGLDADPVARRELAARAAEARQHLQQQADAMFGLARREVAARCGFFVNNESGEDRRESRLSARQLSDLASRLCDNAYSDAPHLHNELINRRQLSSAAASARRVLIEGMLSRADQADLGINEGAPPERAMYLALLAKHGMHRLIDGAYQLAPPPESHSGFGPVWRRVEALLAAHDGQRLPVTEIFAELQRPPFGLKAGVLPVVLTVALVNLDSEVALYEEGAFVPRLSAAVVERLVRSPGKFEVLRSRIDGARAQVFDRFANAFVASPTGRSKNRLVALVKQLAKVVADLPPFALNTKRVLPRTIAVRDALVRAKEPALLVFSTLPIACGLESFDLDAPRSDDAVDQYLHALRTSLDELEGAFPRLLRDSSALLATAFAAPVDLAGTRRELASRAAVVIALAVDPKLKSFLVRASDATLDDTEWLTSLLTQVVGKPPAQWADPDVDAFQARLALLADTFRTFEALAFSSLGRVGGTDDADPLRVAMARLGGAERSLVVRVSKQSASAVERAEAMIEQILRDAGLASNADLALAVLARVAEKYLHIEHREHHDA